jgi:hypothetical protein
MSTKVPRRVATDPDVIRFAFESPPGDPGRVRCARCREDLTLHQPDLQSPGRLLGICGGCRRWYLVVMGPGRDSALMVVVPEDRELRAAWESPGGPA